MVHISELAHYRVGSVEDVIKVGDEVEVLVTDIDPTGRIRLSRRALIEPDAETPPEGAEVNTGAPFDQRQGRSDGGGRPFGDRDRGPRPMGNGRPPRRRPDGDRDRPSRPEGDRPPRRRM